MTEGSKAAVLLAPGALYLFWTTGVFYVFELAADYDVILLVSEQYRQSEAFTRLVAQEKLRVYYVPDLRPVRRLHRYYATEVRRIVEEFRPRFMLSNDIWGMEMLYLFHFGRLQRSGGHPCGRIAIQTSNWLNNVNKDLVEGQKIHAQYYVRKYRMPRFLAWWLVRALMRTFWLLNTFIYPALFVGSPLRPWSHLFGPASSQRDSDGKFDAFLYYTDGEGRVIRPIFAESCRVQKVVHPLRSHEARARGLLRAGPEEKAILLLPSYISALVLQGDLGLTEQAAIEFLAGRWIEIVNRLLRRFPSYPVRWKIHPQLVNDPHWVAVTARVRAAVPQLDVLDPAEKAEKLILEHRVIAGEISTTLMWAAILPEKIVISFDVFGVKYREMAERDNIWYVDDLDDFDRVPLDALTRRGTDGSTAGTPVPTVREYLRQSN